MNKAILIGRLTRDPELRYTNSNRAVCQFTLAVDRPFTNQSTGQREADFINIVVWDKQAENVGKYITKGRLVAVEGRIQTRNYDNNEGKRTYVTEVIASNVEFLGSANDNNRASNNQSPFNENPFDSMEPPVMDTTSVDNDPFASFGEKVEISDNELPF